MPNSPFPETGTGPTWAESAVGAYLRQHAFGAIAYSQTTGRWATSYGQPDRATAETIACDKCGTGDARIVVWGQMTWLALAVGDGGGYGWARDANPEQAKQLALQGCRGTNRRIEVCFDTMRGWLRPARKRPHLSWRGWLSLVILVFAFASFGSAGVFGNGNSANPGGEIIVGIICVIIAALIRFPALRHGLEWSSRAVLKLLGSSARAIHRR